MIKYFAISIKLPFKSMNNKKYKKTDYRKIPSQKWENIIRRAWVVQILSVPGSTSQNLQNHLLIIINYFLLQSHFYIIYRFNLHVSFIIPYIFYLLQQRWRKICTSSFIKGILTKIPPKKKKMLSHKIYVHVLKSNKDGLEY